MNLFNYKSGKKLSKWQSKVLTSYFRLEYIWYNCCYILGTLSFILIYLSPLIILIGLVMLSHYILKAYNI